MASPKPFSSLVPATGMMYMGFPGLPTGGQAWFVDPIYGGDGQSGRRPDRAVATLTQALSLATANQNDIVYMLARSNTAANTTDYQATNLAWNKDGVHLIGINGSPALGQRSRVAQISTWTSASPLITVSANNCLIANIEFFSGVTDATTLGCMSVTGTRNRFANCQISGIGALTNDISGAYSLYLNGGKENLFERCSIGLTTITRTTATASEILIDNTTARNVFLDCFIMSRIGHATQHPQVYLGSATACDDWNLFKRCSFINESVNYGFTQTYVVAAAATPTKGNVYMDQCAAFGATNWSAAGNHVYVSAPTTAALTYGIGYTA